jgi:hypothetical protein
MPAAVGIVRAVSAAEGMKPAGVLRSRGRAHETAAREG